MRTRRTFTATILVALLAIAGVTAAIAADPPPPRIAFVANGRVPADALAAGPTAGQLGAPIYTTEQDSLPPATSNALDAYNPELVIVLGGPVAIADAVVDAIATVTGLPKVDPAPPPATGVVRAAGADRFATAAAIADLLGDYNPAALPADAKAVDADLLDGKDSTAFLRATTIHTSAGGLDWGVYGTLDPTTMTRLTTSTFASGDGVLTTTLHAPRRIGSAAYDLTSVELCYSTVNGAYIADLEVWVDDGERVLNDSTDRSSASYTCFTTPVGSPVQRGASLYVSLAGGGTAELGWVTATWTVDGA